MRAGENVMNYDPSANLSQCPAQSRSLQMWGKGMNNQNVIEYSGLYN